jgi:hypothetical protein
MALPGAAVQLGWVGLADNLAVGSALLGLTWWCRKRPGLAAVAFCAAALGRETTLVVPVALLLVELSRRVPWRSLLPLGASLATLTAWTCVVRVRVGVWPSSAGDARIAPPWSGLTAAVGRWELLDAVVVVALMAALALALRRRPPPVIALVVILSLAGSLFLGWNVWERWEDVTRVLLPASAVAFVALLPATPSAVRGRDQCGSEAESGRRTRVTARTAATAPEITRGT